MTREVKKHTIESLMERTEEVGDCAEWQGYIKNGVPHVSHDGKVTTVRRLMQELQGRSVAGHFISTSCGNTRCVHPSHALARTGAQHLKRMNKAVNKGGLVRVAKLQAAAHSRRKLTDEQVMQIRGDPRPARVVAGDHGVSKALVCAIRSGKSRRLIAAHPFAGLMP